MSAYISRATTCPPPANLTSLEYSKLLDAIEYTRQQCNERFYSSLQSPAALPYLEKSMCVSLEAEGFQGRSPHFCRGGVLNISGSKESIMIDPRTIWINHYTTKSFSEWFSKFKRGRATGFNQTRFVDSNVTEPKDLQDLYSEEFDVDIIASTLSLCATKYSGRQRTCCIFNLLGYPGGWAERDKVVLDSLSSHCHKVGSENPQYMQACQFLLQETFTYQNTSSKPEADEEYQKAC